LAIFLPRAAAGKVTVDIFAGFDLTNPPTGMPFTDYAGRIELPHTAFHAWQGYDFGQPFGLTSFAARISFTMYMSTTGYYIGGLNSGLAPVLWTAGFPNFYMNEGQDWMSGVGFGEYSYEAGLNHFEIIYIAIPDVIPNGIGPNAGTVGGGPYFLNIGFFNPWGGDPRVDHGAYSYVVPDSIETLGGILSAMLALLAIRRKYFGSAA
jgi:hypothetical protein